jgi:pimeloyl-ACP methyl ester carboxylesterase
MSTEPSLDVGGTRTRRSASARRLAWACVLVGCTAHAATPAADVSAHRLGKLEFRACSLTTHGVPDPIDAYCGELEVPVDRAAPAGPRLKLAIAWLKARELASAAPEPTVLLAGGPGQSARSQAAAVGRVLRDLRRRRHLLLVDQRGTGASSPLACPAPDEDEAPDAGVPEHRARWMRACRERFSVDPRFVTTADSVADLEDVRQQLGGVRLDLFGVSYGTRLAQEYARRYPAGVRTMVLDGVVPPSLVLARGAGRALDDALGRSLGTCEGVDGGCEPPLRVLDEALAALATPRQVTYLDPFTGAERSTRFGAADLMSLVHTLAYQPLFIAALPQVFRDARAGNLGLLAAQRRIAMRSAGIELGMHFAVACAEDAPQLTDADAAAEATTRLGREQADVYRAVCRDWPVRPAPAERLTPLHSDVPTLLLSGEWDPVTPPAGAEAVKASLGRARHLVLKGQGHNVFATGCVPKLLAHFIERGALEDLDTSCVERVRALRPFTSRTGWDP